MKKIIIMALLVLTTSLNSLGGALSEGQLQLIKKYQACTKEQKIAFFDEVAKNYSQGLPAQMDASTDIFAVTSLTDRPGLKYFIQVRNPGATDKN